MGHLNQLELSCAQRSDPHRLLQRSDGFTSAWPAAFGEWWLHCYTGGQAEGSADQA